MTDLKEEYRNPVWSTSPPRRRLLHYKAKATLKGVDYLPLEEISDYTGGLTWKYRHGESNGLLNSGVKYGALKIAIDKCFVDNNDFCVLKAEQFDYVDRRVYEPEFGIYFLTTSAQVVVTGFRVAEQ